MAGPSSLTLDYDALLTTTLFNYRKKLEDNISTSNVLLFQLMKKEEGAYEGVDDLGDRAAVPLMYGLAQADSYSGYDALQTSPTDGLTTAFFEWRQASVPISISGLEEKKNKGEAQIISLLESKTKQAELGLQEFFAKGLMQGNGPNLATAITTPRTSPNNGSLFIDPLPLLVKFDPTSSTVIGNINQSTQTWWRNKFKNSGGTTFAGVLKELRQAYNDASKGPGGFPNLHICDQSTYEFYESALAAAHRNPDYGKGDIPFDSIKFKGGTVVWDEFIANASGGTTVQSTTQGTWYMLNTKFIKLRYHKATNFDNTPFQRPDNQDAKVSHIMWLGAFCVMNRRKQNVVGDIDTTVAA